MANLMRSIHARKGKNVFERSLLKATYDGDTEAPKEKHVQRAIKTLQGGDFDVTPEVAFSYFTGLLASGQWVTVLKTQLIMHRSIDKVGPGYGARLTALNIPVGNMSDQSERGSAHNPIIKGYWDYIRSYALNASRPQSMFLVKVVSRSQAISQLNTNQLETEAEYFLTQLENLVKLGPPCYQALRNCNLNLTKDLVGWILRDADNLYSTLHIIIHRLSEQYFYLTSEIACRILNLFSRFEDSTRILWQFFSVGDHLQISDISKPDRYSRPESLVESMKKHAGIENNPPKQYQNLHPDSSTPSYTNTTPPRNDNRVADHTMHTSPTPNPAMHTNPNPGMYTNLTPNPAMHTNPNPGMYTNPNPNPGMYTNPTPNPAMHTNPTPNPAMHTNPNPNPAMHTNPNPYPAMYTNPNPNPAMYTNPNPDAYRNSIPSNPSTNANPPSNPTGYKNPVPHHAKTNSTGSPSRPRTEIEIELPEDLKLTKEEYESQAKWLSQYSALKSVPKTTTNASSKERELEQERARLREREMEWERERHQMKERELEIMKEKAMLERQTSMSSMQMPAVSPFMTMTPVYPPMVYPTYMVPMYSQQGVPQTQPSQSNALPGRQNPQSSPFDFLNN